MKAALIGVVGVAATSLLVSVSAVGCGSNKSSPASSSSSSSASSASSSSQSAPSSSAAAQAGDYSGLLIKATDITPPDGDTFTAGQPGQPGNGQPGVTMAFTNKAGNRTLGDTILIFPDEASAAAQLETAKGALVNVVAGPPGPAADVNPSATIASGSAPDGSKGITTLLFTEGKAFVTMEFDSPPNDIAPPDFVSSLGQKQDAAIKAQPPA